MVSIESDKVKVDAWLCMIPQSNDSVKIEMQWNLSSNQMTQLLWVQWVAIVINS